MKCPGAFAASAAMTAMALTVHLAAAESDYFQIRIVDEQTGRGVPLVEFRTTNHISNWTDSNGIVAWNEPGLMDGDVYFEVQSPGYKFPGGGKTLKIARGGRVELKIKRLNVAERLYRVTGQGIYRQPPHGPPRPQSGSRTQRHGDGARYGPRSHLPRQAL